MSKKAHYLHHLRKQRQEQQQEQADSMALCPSPSSLACSRQQDATFQAMARSEHLERVAWVQAGCAQGRGKVQAQLLLLCLLLLGNAQRDRLCSSSSNLELPWMVRKEHLSSSSSQDHLCLCHTLRLQQVRQPCMLPCHNSSSSNFYRCMPASSMCSTQLHNSSSSSSLLQRPIVLPNRGLSAGQACSSQLLPWRSQRLRKHTCHL
jgi:hypothetical protein